MKKIIDYLNNQKTGIFLLILAVFFCLGTASYNYFAQKGGFIKWGSPDETANYTFAKLYAETGEMEIFEKYNLLAADLIHPRSFRSDFGFLKPVSFLGIILVYGQVASVIGVGLLPYFTPILAALGLIFFYLLIKEIFGKNNALISTTLLAVFPVYIYYTARSFFHNIPFIVFLIMGLYFIVQLLKKNELGFYVKDFDFWKSKFIFPALAGLFIGLAIITRTSEILWIFPLLFIIWVFNIRAIGITKLVVFLGFIWVALMPMFYYNQALYGSFLSGGYNEINQSIQTLTIVSQQNILSTGTVETLAKTVFHFGFNPQQAISMFKHYFVEMFPWLFWPFLAGFLIFLTSIRKWTKRHVVWLLSWLVVSVILVLYYGSWKFTDNPDPNRFTIGNSYTRYWLPIYLGALPFVSLFIQKTTKFVLRGYRPLVGGVRVVLVFAVFLVSLNFVLYGSEEGLVYNWYTNEANRELAKIVWSETETNAAVITQYHDKVLFPERKVIMGTLSDDSMNYYYSNLAHEIPVYYFNFQINQPTLDYLNSSKLAKFGAHIKLVKLVSRDFGLYRIEVNN
jgi:hypothetical protein